MQKKRFVSGRTLLLACTFAWMAVITVAMLTQRLPVGRFLAGIAGADVVFHALIFSILCALLIWTVTGPSWRQRFGAAAVATLFGCALECIQPLHGRSFEVVDVLGNAAGAAAGMFMGGWRFAGIGTLLKGHPR